MEKNKKMAELKIRETLKKKLTELQGKIANEKDPDQKIRIFLQYTDQRDKIRKEIVDEQRPQEVVRTPDTKELAK